VLAYRARTAAHLASIGYSGMTGVMLTEILDKLWAGRYFVDGRPGFGIREPRDDFNDGSLNPIRTIYTYTTATTTLAFLDGYAVTRKPTMLARARESVETILDRCWDERQGAVWYSDRPADHGSREFVILNVNALCWPPSRGSPATVAVSSSRRRPSAR
jgi:hypothetical protein